MLAGCAGTRPGTGATPPAPPSSVVPTTQYHDHGIAFQYPAAWKPAKDDTAVFRIVAPGTATADLTLYVPAVPGFAAAFVNPTIVGSHYGEDEKKQQIPDAVVTFTDVPAAGGTGRRIKLVGHDAQGHPAINEAVALVHAGRVYIFSTDTDAAGLATAEAALNAAVGSIQWES